MDERVDDAKKSERQCDDHRNRRNDPVCARERRDDVWDYTRKHENNRARYDSLIDEYTPTGGPILWKARCEHHQPDRRARGEYAAEQELVHCEYPDRLPL